MITGTIIFVCGLAVYLGGVFRFNFGAALLGAVIAMVGVVVFVDMLTRSVLAPMSLP